MAQGRAFFISPDGEILNVYETHIAMVIHDPERFGWTLRRLQAAYDRHRERFGIEANAREQILKKVLAASWIRIREYVGHETYWSFQFGRWSPLIARRARRWAKLMLADRGARPYDEVRLMGLDGTDRRLPLSKVPTMKTMDRKAGRRSRQEGCR